MRMDQSGSSQENVIMIILVPFPSFWREEVPIPLYFLCVLCWYLKKHKLVLPLPIFLASQTVVLGTFFFFLGPSHSLAFFILSWGFLEEDWRQEQAYPQARAKEQLNWLK